MAEHDFIGFNSGTNAPISITKRKGRLVV